MTRFDPPPQPPQDPPSEPLSGGPAGASRFQRMRMRRGAPPRDAVLRMEHFHITAAEKRRREAMERSRGRLLIAAGLFAALFTVVSFRVAWVTVLRPVAAKVARDVIPQSVKAP